MATTATKNPLSDLMYDWLTVLQSKAEGLAAYERYVKDAEEANATECVDMLNKLREQESAMLCEIKKHVFGMIAESEAKEAH
ncbi:MAG TPA: hypothetical protein VGJ26_14650 [Pirellulales bacterium]|jgi:hypothetical protein